MQSLNPKTGVFLEYLGATNRSQSWGSYKSDENADNPYMLDAINEIDVIFALYRRDYFVASFKTLGGLMDCGVVQRGAFGKYAQEGRGERRMVRVSKCKDLVATVYESSICVHTQKSGAIYQYEEEYENDFETLEEEKETVAEFILSEGKYSYLEWAPLNRDYIDSTESVYFVYMRCLEPSFLTLDDKGNLRLHFLNEENEQIVESGEVYRSATFSLGGKYIYAINQKQELCQIDLEGLKIVMKRKIEGLSNPEEVISSHIQQVTPWIFAIGSLMKVENEGAIFKPYFHLVYGDIEDEKEELKIKPFEMPLFEEFDSKKPVIFRTLYIKERELLLFGHSGSNTVRVLHFELDGIETEIEALSLGTRTLRGIIFMKGKRPRELKNEYQNKQLESSMGPEIVVLDSEGDIHYFRYFNTLSSAPTLSLFMRYLSIKEFMQKQEKLKARMNRTRKNRCKSQEKKSETPKITKKKKRSKSQVSFTREKISSEEKQKTTKFLKENPLPNISSKPVGNPFLSFKKTENKPTISSLFPTKTEDSKPMTSGLFSTISSSTKTTRNSLSSFSSQSNFLFQKAESNNLFRKSLASPENNLFSKIPQSTTNNLFSSGTQNKLLQKIPDDPIKKRSMLFLNKLGSDVTFKVENQEFPAHKDILSEKCKFFKNMFSSGMSESYAPVIEIPDTKASMFKAFLEYVYMGQAILNEELAIGLFGFSEKYMIEELRVSCEKYLLNVLSLKNCFKIFETACFHEADSLKKKALQFFRDHLKEITEMKDFEDLPKETYIYIKRIQWNEKIILDPSFHKYIKS